MLVVENSGMENAGPSILRKFIVYCSSLTGFNVDFLAIQAYSLIPVIKEGSRAKQHTAWMRVMDYLSQILKNLAQHCTVLLEAHCTITKNNLTRIP